MFIQIGIPFFVSFLPVFDAEFKALPWLFSLPNFIGYKGPNPRSQLDKIHSLDINEILNYQMFLLVNVLIFHSRAAWLTVFFIIFRNPVYNNIDCHDLSISLSYQFCGRVVNPISFFSLYWVCLVERYRVLSEDGVKALFGCRRVVKHCCT